jgi:hypothetical protein
MNTDSRPALLPVPKAAKRLIDDARVAGFEVTVNHCSVALDVTVKSPHGAQGTATWAYTIVYEGLLRDTRLGFRTSGGKEAVRFSFASVEVPYGPVRYPHIKSVRALRLYVGLGE